ncbi:MAG: hypothetical protein J0I36_07765, partial [Pandoraea sp.]|nr:hypothetical protein [Pandoraea sp.]
TLRRASKAPFLDDDPKIVKMTVIQNIEWTSEKPNYFEVYNWFLRNMSSGIMLSWTRTSR